MIENPRDIGERIDKAVIREYLKKWHLPQASISLPHNAQEVLRIYYNALEKGEYVNLYITGYAPQLLPIAAAAVSLVVDLKLIKTRASLIFAPEMVLAPIYDPSYDAKIETSDLSIIHELAPTKLLPERVLYLHNVLVKRIMSQSHRFIFTSSNPPEEVTSYTSKALMDYISDSSYILNIGG